MITGKTQSSGIEQWGLARQKSWPEYEGIFLHGVSTPEKILETMEGFARVLNAVGHLPRTSQRIVRSYYLEGKTTQEIADELGYSITVVRRLRNRAIKWARGEMLGG